jgi:hypothetical protein
MAVDYTEEVVAELGSPLLASSGGGSYGPESLKWDCSIGGLDFLYATSQTYPMRRETGKFRRERIDTERSPGEQSLDSGLWLRSQASWHYGAGLSSAEPLEVDSTEASFRYYKSGGVDPWTPGQLQLLKDTDLAFASTKTSQTTIGIGTGVLHAGDDVLTYVDNAESATAVTWGGTGNINSLTDSGQYYFAANSEGIWRGDLPSGTGTKIYNKSAGTVTSQVIRWVKTRLMYGENNRLFEITNLTPTSATLPSALYTHPNSGWVWTDISEGPAAIYASGYSREFSAIYRINVASTTTAVTLSVPTVVAEMPRGEDILSLYSYVGSFLIVGTTLGMRVAAISDDGSLTMGPLLWDGTIVDDAVAFGSYVYVTVRDKGEAGDNVQRSGLYRVNLGQTLNNNPLLFAHAPDLISPVGTTGEARSVTVSGGKLWFSVNGTGLIHEQSTFVSSGWIETGRIRLGTMERKAWRDLRIIGINGLQGSISGYASVTGAGAPSTWDRIVEANGANTDVEGKLNPAAPAPAPDLHLAFHLESNPACSCSSRMIGYQVRAVPSPRRNELIQIPVLMFDWETDRQGVKYGAEGNAWKKFQLLKQMEANGATVVYRDYTTTENVEVYVEEVAYIRNTPPSNGLSRTGSGGVATVLLRTV